MDLSYWTALYWLCYLLVIIFIIINVTPLQNATKWIKVLKRVYESTTWLKVDYPISQYHLGR